MEKKSVKKLVITFVLFLSSLNVSSQDVQPAFTFPDIPAELKTPELRLNFLVSHYWDNFDFRNTACINNTEVTEQALVNFIDLLTRVPQAKADSCVINMLYKSSEELEVLKYFTDLLHKYYMEPNSPFHNEEAYIPAADFLINYEDSDDAMRTKAKFDLKIIMLNKRGSIANDFTYTLSSNEQHKMHDLQSEYTILLFYDVDCVPCNELMNYMRNSFKFTSKEFLERVSVLAFYTGDETKKWELYQTNVPEGWINAYDSNGTVTNEMLYNVEATPSIYVLDKNKHVILKDALIEEVEAFFDNI